MKRLAFTMAEILLSLTIIGVVAAITLPSLTGNINERTWNTQRKALYARFSQALPLMGALNGYGTLTEKVDENGTKVQDENGKNVVDVDTAAETFITAGLSKVLKINNICDNTHLADCGIPEKINTLGGSPYDTPTTFGTFNSYFASSASTTVDSYSLIDTKAAAFETQNGESILTYYNPNCRGSLNNLAIGNGGTYYPPMVCANFVYDLNGTKGPNTVGKDIGFLTVLYPFDALVVAPMPANNKLSTTHNVIDASGITAAQACTNFDAEYRLPNVSELISMAVNNNLIKSSTSDLHTGSYYWSSTRIYSHGYESNLGVPMAWAVRLSVMDDYGADRNLHNVWCIKR